MSNKSFCDKCGAEVKIIGAYGDGEMKTENVIGLRKNGPDYKRKIYDLCDACVLKFETWINTREVVLNQFYGGNYTITSDNRNMLNCIGNPTVPCNGPSFTTP